MTGNFFTFFPQITYDIDRSGVKQRVTNIMKRFITRKILRSKAVIYYTYDVKDGERPDIVSAKFYNDSRLDWLILLTNMIYDPLYQWPLSYPDFIHFIKAKYGKVSTAQDTVHHYEWIVQQREILSDGSVRPERVVAVDEATYLSTPDSDRRVVYAYDWEKDLNETRRNIRIIQPQFLPQILKEVTTVING